MAILPHSPRTFVPYQKIKGSSALDPHFSLDTPPRIIIIDHMARKRDLLRNQDHPTVFGHEIDRQTLTPIRRPLPPRIPGRDYGADPLGDGTFRMVPSGDVVDFAERNRRLNQ